MPPLIGAAIAAAVGATGFAATAITAVVSIVAGIGLQLIMKLLQPDQKQKVASVQFTSKQASPPRRRSYGRVQLSGPKIAYDAVGGSYYDAIYLGEGPYDSVQGILMDDKYVTTYTVGTEAAVVGIYPWVGYVEYQIRLGQLSQVASYILMQLPYWSADHRLNGCAYFVTHAGAPPEKHFKKFFPSGRPPEPRVQLHAAKVRDCRVSAHTTDPSTWEYRDISSPCIYDFVTHERWGMKVPHSLMNTASWAAAADLDDGQVPVKAGGTQQRYRLGGTYEMTDDPADVLEQMLATRDGALTLEIDGTIGITGGKFPTPTVTITEDMIISIGTLEVGTGKLSAFNRLKITYTSPIHDYQLVEGDAWDDLDAQNEADETLEADFARIWVPYHFQLRRLAKIYSAKENPKFRLTGVVTNMAAAGALFEESVRLKLDRFGIDMTFLVRRAVAQPGSRRCLFDLTSLRPDAYDFDPATEEGTEPPVPLSLNDTTQTAVDVPTVDLAYLERRRVSGRTNAVFLHVHAAAASRTDLTLAGRYRRSGDTTYTEMYPEGEDARGVVSQVLEDGETYEYQVRFETYGQSQVSDWTTTATVVATADAAAPNSPTGGSVTMVSPGTYRLNWTSSDSDNVDTDRVYHSATTSTFDPSWSPILILGATRSNLNTATFTPGPGTHNYWITSANASGVESDGVGANPGPLGPLTFVV